MKSYHLHFYVSDTGDLKLQVEIKFHIYLKYSDNCIKSTEMQEKL